MSPFRTLTLGVLLSLVLFAGCQQAAPSDETPSDGSDSTPVMTVETKEGEWVSYGEDFRGYLVEPMDDGSYPGVVMIHEWWGLNDNIKEMADKLASEGYIVLAVDLYDGRVADVPDDARVYATEVRESPERAITHMQAAAEYLRGRSNASGKIASMGWCFGGQQSLQLAMNDQLDATVIYYGNLETDEEALDTIDWPILGIFGEEDTSVTVESVEEFGQALTNLSIQNEIYIYPEVGHAFANPSNPGHDPGKTEDAWQRTSDFLRLHLKS